MIEFNIKKNKAMRIKLLNAGCKQVGSGKCFDNFITSEIDKIPNNSRIMTNHTTLKKFFKKSYIGQHTCVDLNENQKHLGVDLKWLKKDPMWLSGKQFKFLKK